MTPFALRLPDYVMEQAKAASSEDRVSINQLLISFISEGLGHRSGLKMIRDRAGRADIEAAVALLDMQIPDVAPDVGDEVGGEVLEHGQR
jgi:hypothetical protein